MVRSFSRGHKIIFISSEWVYEDTRNKIDPMRPCKRCGKAPFKTGEDACLGHINGVSSACCGHGVESPYVITTGELYGSR